MRLRSTAKDAIQRYEMIFLNSSRECVFRKDAPEMIVADKKYGPFKRGDRISLPNWIIERLMSKDLVEIVASDAHESLRQLQNIRREEEKHPFKLQKFDEFIYAAMNRKMHRLERDKTDLDPRKYDEIEKLKKISQLIVETRLSKVLRVAKAGSYKERSGEMANEERWLCKELSELLDGWRQNMAE